MKKYPVSATRNYKTELINMLGMLLTAVAVDLMVVIACFM